MPDGGRERRSNYTGLDFAEMLRRVSTDKERIYFTDIDFIAYSYEKGNLNLKIVMEVKRSYMVVEVDLDEFNFESSQCRDYKLVNSDTVAIYIAESLKLPFIYVFYEENRLEDTNRVLLVWLKEYLRSLSKSNGKYILNICLQDRNMVKLCTISKFKDFLRCLTRQNTSYESCWSNL